MSLKNSQTIEDLKHKYIYGSVHKDGRRSLKSLDNLIKKFELSPSTIYRRSSKERYSLLWRSQLFNLDRFNRVLGRYSLRFGTAV